MIVMKKRKLKRRERNHFRREQKAREITGDSAGAGSAGGSAETSLLVQPATADPTLSEADLGAVVEQLGFLPTSKFKLDLDLDTRSVNQAQQSPSMSLFCAPCG